MKRVALLALALLPLVACGMFTNVECSSNAATFKYKLPPETLRELANVRSATARYLNISQAMEQGYVDINVFVSGQGFHYLMPTILDNHFQVDKPEILVYALDPFKHNLRLVAVEYAVPENLSPTPPEGFTGSADVWKINEHFGLWTLHCWVWLDNPNGIFAEFSPLVP